MTTITDKSTTASVRTRRSSLVALITACVAWLGLLSSLGHAQTAKSRSAQELTTVIQSQAIQTSSGQAADKKAIRPFHVSIPDEALVDLRRRIAATRWPDRETVNDPSQGVQLAKLQELVRYWGSGYDWRKVEARLNTLPQFTTNIDGGRYPLHPRSLKASKRTSSDHHARLAGIGD